MKCPTHEIELITFCPACRGSVRSERKTESSRENGKLGGRPRLKKKAKKIAPKREMQATIRE